LGKPVIGICLGSQIIAKALGANVYKGQAGKEIGWHNVHMTEAGAQTPLKYFDAGVGPVMQWHGDTFDLPDGAVLLASSACYPHQAFSYGDHVLAVQFHPEVTELKLERWYENQRHEIAEMNLCVNALRADAHLHGDALKQRNRKFLTEWIDTVAPHLLEKELA
jgi:GMP synthase (glutamine-hydrolysing)